MHNDQLVDSFEEADVVSKGLPPPRPWPSDVVDAGVVAALVTDDADEDVEEDVATVTGAGVVTKTEVDDADVDEFTGGGMKVTLVVVAVAVDCIGVVVCMIVGLSMLVDEARVRVDVAVDFVVVRGSVDVFRVVEVVVDGDRVTASKRQASMIKMPFCAKYRTEFGKASTLAQLLCTASSMSRIPDLQSLEQRCEAVKSVVVQPVIVAW